ncbi:hypothetical protein C3L33_01262, partial [Rhododendron williamsianum]
ATSAAAPTASEHRHRPWTHHPSTEASNQSSGWSSTASAACQPPPRLPLFPRRLLPPLLPVLHAPHRPPPLHVDVPPRLPARSISEHNRRHSEQQSSGRAARDPNPALAPPGSGRGHEGPPDNRQGSERAEGSVRGENPRPVIAVTPTYVRTFQTLHLTGVMHSLMNVPYDLTWIVVEAGGTTNETAWLVARSELRVVHVGFEEEMPVSWDDRHRLEARMRLRALELKLEGIVMFADDSNMHSMELFDEIQKVKWVGAVSVGILVHLGDPEEESSVAQKDDVENSPMPVQGPACNSSDQKLEWAGFVLNSRLLWKENEVDKPEWVKDLDTVGGDAEDIETPLSLLKDPSVVEPLGSCGRKILLWWLRVEARADSKFPARWIIDTPMEVTVPSKRTPWPDAPPELPSNETTITTEENREKPGTKTRPRKSKRSSRSKKKRESSVVDTHSARNSGEQ